MDIENSRITYFGNHTLRFYTIVFIFFFLLNNKPKWILAKNPFFFIFLYINPIDCLIGYTPCSIKTGYNCNKNEWYVLEYNIEPLLQYSMWIRAGLNGGTTKPHRNTCTRVGFGIFVWKPCGYELRVRVTAGRRGYKRF